MKESLIICPEVSATVNRFSLGCVVNDKTFVQHFKSDDNLNQSVDEIISVFQNYKKRLLIQFQTFEEIPMNASIDCPVVEREDTGEETVNWISSNSEFVVNYSQIKSVHFNGNQLFIKLLFPPILYTILKEKYFHFDCHSSDNSSNVSEEEEDDVYDEGIEDAVIDIFDDRQDSDEDLQTFRLRSTKLFDINEDNFTKINAILIELNDNQLLPNIISNIEAFDPLIVTKEIFFDRIQCKPFVIDWNLMSELPFDVKYLLEAMTNQSFYLTDCLHINDNSIDEFFGLVKKLTEINVKSVEQSLSDLQIKIENNLNLNPMNDFLHSFDKNCEQMTKKWTNPSVIKVRRCVVTPTRILLLPALPLQESRFLRTCDPENVIRVLIKDEDLQLLSFTACKTSSLPDRHPFVNKVNEFLGKTVLKRLMNGIQIGGRVYELLGASTSQLRDHGLIFYAKDGQQRNAKDIQQLIGDLQSLTNSAKFIARIGQSMSQSMAFISNVNCVSEDIEDITGGLNPGTEKPYVFSDGVGMISKDMANELCIALNVKDVSTFQIRFAGFKGIIVLNPHLRGRKILMRPSMKKFESNSTDLDVLKVSEPRSCYLNRPLIVILNQRNGVSNSVFLKLLYNRQKELVNAFACNCKAVLLLKNYSALNLHFDELLSSGVDLLNEPFFVSIMESIIRKVSLDLRNKARILVPFDFGRVMYGVLDETNTLQYGEVFVQYTHRGSGTKQVLTGEVLVTKYPCMHAGDVRKMIAVDIPQLHHIVDCIAFPALGHRPHPDEMAGSDLDGDEYSVIWYKPLIPKRDNCPPMHFPSNAAIDMGRPASSNEDILSFYCRFMANNQVGLIASSHLVWSDFDKYGVHSSVCNHLAHKYAVALDYAKTGINARLQNKQKPIHYPDFMMKFAEKPTYSSDKALGKLYQKNCFFYDTIYLYLKQISSNFNPNPYLIHENSGKYMNDAKQVFEMYRNSIKELKEQFGIESESELIGSTFVKSSKYLSTLNDNNDTHDLVYNLVKRLFSDFLDIFKSGITAEDDYLAKASAWYRTTHEMNSNESDQYLGFTWIVSSYLAKLCVKNGSKGHDCTQTTQSVLDNEMIDISKVSQIVNIILKNEFENYSIKMIEYIENTTNEVLKKYGFDNNFITNEYISLETEDKNKRKVSSIILTEIFDRLSDEVDFEDDQKFDIGMSALVANFKIRRVGLMKILKQFSKGSEHLMDCSVFVIRISESLKEIISSEEQQFVSYVKQLTGLFQIVIHYGTEGTSISVYGHYIAIEKFRRFIINRQLVSELKDKMYY